MVNAFRWMVFVIGLAVVIGGVMVTSAENPTIRIYTPSNDDTVYTKTITVSGGASRGTDGAVVESVTVKGYLAEGTTSWSKDISLQLGQNKITAVATDRSGKCGNVTIYVTYIEPNSTPTNESSPTPTLTPPITPNGRDRGPTPMPTPTPTGSISITTIPPGAEVYLDTSPKGTSPITLENVTEGRHKIKVIKEGYRIATREPFLWGDETIKWVIALKPLKGSISVSSTPDKASVDLDNFSTNKNTSCWLSEVAVGQHTIKLTKSDYFNETENVSVFVGRTSHLHINLTGYGSISISSNPSGASVYLDGNYTEETTPMNISKVVVGNHTIKLTKFGYDDVIRNVSVSVGETHSLDENLTGYGSISISSNPSGASVYLDGNYTEETTPTNISKVVQGNHSIEFKKGGYKYMTKNIEVSAGVPTPVHVRLNHTVFGKLTDSGGVPYWAIIILTCAALVGIISSIGGFIKWMRVRRP